MKQVSKTATQPRANSRCIRYGSSRVRFPPSADHASGYLRCSGARSASDTVYVWGRLCSFLMPGLWSRCCVLTLSIRWPWSPQLPWWVSSVVSWESLLGGPLVGFSSHKRLSQRFIVLGIKFPFCLKILTVSVACFLL